MTSLETYHSKPEEKLNPFAVEIIRSAVIATTDEMKANLCKTSYTPTVYEAQDFTVAMTDGDGNLMSIGLGLPSFIRGIADTVKAFRRHYGDDIHPGDMLLTNDSQTHGSHLNHMIVALPVFYEGEIVAFTCAEPHWTDIGGVYGFGTGGTTDIYSEGLQLPYLKIYKKGVLDKELISIIEMNVRRPDLAMGDFRGEVACVRTGEKRIVHLAKKYGKSTFVRTLDTIKDQAEEFSRRQIQRIPAGTYEAEQFLDDDGIEVGRHIPIKVKITVRGERMTVDLSGMGKQVRGPYNSRAGVSGAQMGFKTVICPTWLPVNDGSFRPLDVILPPGTVVSAEKPAAMRRWMVMPMNIADTMWKALAPAVPEMIAAGHHGDLIGGGGGAPVDTSLRHRLLAGGGGGGGGLSGGGYGAKYNEDGASAVVCLNDGDTHNNPIEAGEFKNPYNLVIRKELRQDSGGAGRFRGGLGVVVEVVHFYDSMANSLTERGTCPPWGAQGGMAGLANTMAVKVAKHKPGEVDLRTRAILDVPLEYEEHPNATHPSTKFYGKFLPAGSRSMSLSGGGGGFGDPKERDTERVLDDLKNGYVSPEAARRDYRVVVDPRTMQLDSAKTTALRGS